MSRLDGLTGIEAEPRANGNLIKTQGGAFYVRGSQAAIEQAILNTNVPLDVPLPPQEPAKD